MYFRQFRVQTLPLPRLKNSRQNPISCGLLGGQNWPASGDISRVVVWHLAAGTASAGAEGGLLHPSGYAEVGGVRLIADQGRGEYAGLTLHLAPVRP